MSELEILCKKKKVRIKSYYGEAPQNESFPNSHPYKVVLRFQNRQITTSFHMGEAHTGEPTAADVISCLISDASCYENAQDIDDFAAELGYTSIKEAVQAYRACEKITPRIRRFLGDDFDAFAAAEH